MNGTTEAPVQVKDHSLFNRICLCGLGLALLLQFTPCHAAEDSSTDMILINNVRLIDREGQTEDQTVNILIKEERLDIVS
jgi:hypothetical protein